MKIYTIKYQNKELKNLTKVEASDWTAYLQSKEIKYELKCKSTIQSR